MARCEQEMCRNWTGDGCACVVLGLDPDVAVMDTYEYGFIADGQVQRDVPALVAALREDDEQVRYWMGYGTGMADAARDEKARADAAEAEVERLTSKYEEWDSMHAACEGLTREAERTAALWREEHERAVRLRERSEKAEAAIARVRALCDTADEQGVFVATSVLRAALDGAYRLRDLFGIDPAFAHGMDPDDYVARLRGALDGEA